MVPQPVVSGQYIKVVDLFVTVLDAPKGTRCATDYCKQSLDEAKSCMLELDTGLYYCVPCGKCRRYERKQEALRDNHTE